MALGLGTLALVRPAVASLEVHLSPVEGWMWLRGRDPSGRAFRTELPLAGVAEVITHLHGASPDPDLPLVGVVLDEGTLWLTVGSPDEARDLADLIVQAMMHLGGPTAEDLELVGVPP